MCERPEPSVAVIRIDCPERRNALCLEVKRQLDEAFVAAEADPDARVIVLTGGESFFVGGTDIGETLHMTSGEHTANDTGRVFRTINLCRKPVCDSETSFHFLEYRFVGALEFVAPA
ncbi:enoyl-CoA hydratase-related protein [Paraburkholderia phytofirmans]|uniref:Enoyl-CoA hydratase-related protein n=1 Tax=Paraburkholderia phytofirmans TaxID=261302 RepID=A0ABW9BBG7_9BURK